jgi:hypothetical protein
MAQKLTINCDVDGCELSGRDLVEMTTVSILFNDCRMRDVKGEGGKIKPQKVVFNQERYEFHIGEEHSKEFIKHVQEFFTTKAKLKKKKGK